MDTTINYPVVYRYDEKPNNRALLQEHLERLGFATDEFRYGIDAFVDQGWLVRGDGDGKTYVSLGWEQRIAALEPDCSLDDLSAALGGAGSVLEELERSIYQWESAGHEYRILPFSIQFFDLNGDTVAEYAAPHEWVESLGL